MVIETNELVITDSEQMENIIKNKNLGGKYCDFQSFHADVMKKLETLEKDAYIDQTMYFDAAVKLGLIIKGTNKRWTIQRNEGDEIVTYRENFPTFRENPNGAYHPPKEIADAMLRELYEGDDKMRTVYNGIYRLRRKNFGFNCENEVLLDAQITQPIVEILGRLNDALLAADTLSETEIEAVKSLGINVSDAKRARRERAMRGIL